MRYVLYDQICTVFYGNFAHVGVLVGSLDELAPGSASFGIYAFEVVVPEAIQTLLCTSVPVVSKYRHVGVLLLGTRMDDYVLA